MIKPMRNQPASWNLTEDYYRSIEEGYDALAPSYDQDIGSNPVGQRMHAVFREVLRAAFSGCQKVFEIGCGTGTDALWLARSGLEVVATDISQEMVGLVREKARAEGLADRIQVAKLRACEIAGLAREHGRESFDGGYCHAGALNMEPAIQCVPAQIQQLLRRGGAFVCSVINKTSLFELLFYSLVLRPRKAFRRLGNVIPIPISRSPPLNQYVVPARFYSPSEVVSMFRPGFALEALQGLQIFLPPANLADYYAAANPLFSPLEVLEAHLSKTPPLNAWGNHSIMTFRRTQ